MKGQNETLKLQMSSYRSRAVSMQPVHQREVLNTPDVGDNSPDTQAHQKLYDCTDPIFYLDLFFE